MDSKLKENAKKKLKEGWIRSWMMIEVLAVTKETAKSSLEKHIGTMNREKKTIVFNKKFHDIKKIENPMQNIKEAYSHVVELEVLTEDYETLVYLIMNYAPSSIEIVAPETIKMDMGEAQGILNSVADMLHRFVASGKGNVVIRT